MHGPAETLDSTAKVFSLDEEISFLQGFFAGVRPHAIYPFVSRLLVG